MIMCTGAGKNAKSDYGKQIISRQKFLQFSMYTSFHSAKKTE